MNETLRQIPKNIEASAKGTDREDDLKGLFDDVDANCNKLGGTVQKWNEKLVRILDAITGLKLGDFQSNSIDAYEPEFGC